jgi:hypothetical protein
MAHRYTNDQHEFIRHVAPGRYNAEIAELFNAKFGTDLTVGQIKSYKKNHHITSGVSKRRMTEVQSLFTKEQKAFLKENVKGLSNQELTDLVNQTFGLTLSVSQVKAYKNRRKWDSGLTGQFEKGSTPVNKGKKCPGQSNVTSFKAGQRPYNFKPVGTERVDKEGYHLIKVTDDGPWHKRWRLKHTVIWEKANGLVPKGHCLIFLDGNHQNVTLDNLQLITRKQLARLNQHRLISDNAELTKTGIILADIYSKIGERKRAK